MKLSFSSSSKKLLLVLLTIAASISLSGLILLNLPSYYEQTLQSKWIIFPLLSILLFGCLFLSAQILILPNKQKLCSKQGVLFIAIIMPLLVFLFAFSDVYYWSVPVSHRVEICFDASDDAPQINIQRLVTPLSNRVHSPLTFGASRYPITVPSGSCVSGEIITLYTHKAQWWEVPGLTVILPTAPPNGRFYLSINEIPAVVQLQEQTDTEQTNEITYRDGFEFGEPLLIANHVTLSRALKWLGIFISALYLSLLLFGLIEKIISPPQGEIQDTIGKTNGIS